MKEYLGKEKEKEKKRQNKIVAESTSFRIAKNINSKEDPKVETQEEFEKRDRREGKILGIVVILISIGFLGTSGTRIDEMEMVMPCMIALLGIAFLGISCKSNIARLLGFSSFGIVAITFFGFIVLLFVVFVWAGITTLLGIV